MRKVCEGTNKNKYGGCAPKPRCKKCVRVPKKTNMEAVPPNRGAKSVWGYPKKPNMEAVPPNRGAKSVWLYPKNPINPKFHTTICHMMCVSCFTRSIVVWNFGFFGFFGYSHTLFAPRFGGTASIFGFFGYPHTLFAPRFGGTASIFVFLGTLTHFAHIGLGAQPPYLFFGYLTHFLNDKLYTVAYKQRLIFQSDEDLCNHKNALRVGARLRPKPEEKYHRKMINIGSSMFWMINYTQSLITKDWFLKLWGPMKA